MQKFALGVVIALTLAVLAYAGTIASRDFRSSPAAKNTVQRSPEELAARQRMARLVAEVAARSAAQTARTVALDRMHQQQVRAAAEKSAQAAAETTVAANK